MEQIAIRNLTFAYDAKSDFSLRQISLQVEQGEILLITGASGCGKTTLLKHLKMEYMPHGLRNQDSEIRINGKRIEKLNEREQASMVGFVGQHVDACQVTDKVWHELAFGLENLGYPQDVMQRKVAEMTAFFGLEGIYHEQLCNLSGGQKQLVNLASVMVMEPDVLVLDEPTSQLDPIAATEFFRMVEKINKELGTTILMTEHRLEEVFAMCHRVCVMEHGRITDVDTPDRIARRLYNEKHILTNALPAAAKLYLRLENNGRDTSEHSDENRGIPLTVNEGRSWLKEYVEREQNENTLLDICTKTPADFPKAEYALIADELWFRYEKNGKDILKACSLNLEQGRITAILGGNGAGKSTLLNVIAGHFAPYLGKVKKVSGRIGILPQNPQAMFTKKTVEEELQVSLEQSADESEEQGQEKRQGHNKGRKALNAHVKKSLRDIIEFCDLQQVLSQHPFDLSGGQMQKLALAKILLEDKDILLLDEPGKGMDYAYKTEMGQLLQQLVSQGKTVLMVSHDVEFCAHYADICGLFFDGAIVSLEESRSFFRQNTFYTTAVARICRDIIPEAVVVEDVKGRAEKASEEEKVVLFHADSVRSVDLPKQQTVIKAGRPGMKAGRWITLFMVLIIMPATIFVGHAVLLQRKYYFISLLLVMEAIACFFITFEKRKPKIREIMIISVMSAIVIAGRAAFYMIPNVKPMAALIIIGGIGLGAEAGFLIGSMSMLVSNMFFGQGPWTPWQMFAMGMLGFLAGIVFKQNTELTKKRKYAICIYGFLAVVLVYGSLMNSASVLMYQENVTFEMLLASCAMGFPYDVMHGAGTFAFLWIGTRPMLEKLKRVRQKSLFTNCL